MKIWAEVNESQLKEFVRKNNLRAQPKNVNCSFYNESGDLLAKVEEGIVRHKYSIFIEQNEATILLVGHLF